MQVPVSETSLCSVLQNAFAVEVNMPSIFLQQEWDVASYYALGLRNDRCPVNYATTYSELADVALG